MVEVAAADIISMTEGPQRITGEEGTVEERNMDDVIKGDRYGISKGLTKAPHGIYMNKIRFGSTR